MTTFTWRVQTEEHTWALAWKDGQLRGDEQLVAFAKAFEGAPFTLPGMGEQLLELSKAYSAGAGIGALLVELYPNATVTPGGDPVPEAPIPEDAVP